MSNTQESTKGTLVSKFNEKTLAMSVVASVAMMSVASTATAGAFEDAVKSDRTSASSLTGNQGAAEQGLSSIYNLGKYIAIVIGLFLAIGGLMAVSKAAKTEGQKSQMPGWISFGIGGLLTVVGFFMFAVGKTATNVIGADGTTTGG